MSRASHGIIILVLSLSGYCHTAAQPVGTGSAQPSTKSSANAPAVQNVIDQQAASRSDRILSYNTIERSTSARFSGTHLAANESETMDVISEPAPNSCLDYCCKSFKIQMQFHAGGDKITYELGKDAWTELCSLNVTIKGRTSSNPETWVDIQNCSNLELVITSPSTGTSPEGKPEVFFTLDIASKHPQSCDGTGATYDQIKFLINSVAIPSSPSNIIDYLRLEVSYVEEFSQNVTSSTSSAEAELSMTVESCSTLTHQAPGGGTYQYSVAVCTNPVTFHWENFDSNCSDSLPNYQIQILRLYNHDAALALNEECVRTVVDWKKALTIETGTKRQEITLTLAEGRGYYLFRVRAIGNYYRDGVANPQNWGPWSASPAQGSSIQVGPSSSGNWSQYTGISSFFYDQFDDNKNWTYSRSFAESDDLGPRISENIEYTDALMNPAQSQVKLQTKSKIMVAQTVLDFNGRASMQSIAVPVSQNKLEYVDKVMKYDGSTPGLYTAAHFDVDVPNTTPRTTAAPLAVSTSSTIGSYFSNSNSDVNIPNAAGYPFVRTLFARDGRIKEQSGVGSMHSLSQTNRHTLRKIYTAVADSELTSIFGDEALDAKACSKTITIDQNDVASVEYTSKEGHVIATCIIDNGEIGTGVDGTTHKINSDGSRSLLNLSGEKVNIMTILPVTSTVGHAEIQSGGAMQPELSSRSITVLGDNTDVHFTYTLKFKQFSVDWRCIFTGDCKYKATLSIINEVTGEDVTSSTLPSNTSRTANLPGTGASPGNMVTGWDIDVTLDRGQYTFSVLVEQDISSPVTNQSWPDYEADQILNSAHKNITPIEDILHALFHNSSLPTPMNAKDSLVHLQQYYNAHFQTSRFLSIGGTTNCDYGFEMPADITCNVNDPYYTGDTTTLNFELYLKEELNKNPDVVIEIFKKPHTNGTAIPDVSWSEGASPGFLSGHTLNYLFRKPDNTEQFPTSGMPNPAANNNGWGIFNQILRFMVTEQYRADQNASLQTVYSVDELFKLWKSCVGQFIASWNQRDSEGKLIANNGYMTGFESKSTSSTGRMRFDLLGRFLDAAGYNFSGTSTDTYDRSTGYLIRPYKYFNESDFSSGNLTQCLKSQNSSYTAMSSISGDYLPARNERALIYNCVRNYDVRPTEDFQSNSEFTEWFADCGRPQVAFNVNDPTWKSYKRCLQNIADRIVSKCKTSCDDMFDYFRAELKKRYEEIGKLYFYGDRRPDQSVVGTNDTDIIPAGEFYCRVEMLKNDCVNGCKLDVRTTSSNDSYEIYGDTTKVFDRLIGRPEVQFPQSTNPLTCTTGFTPLSTSSNRLLTLLKYLEERYKYHAANDFYNSLVWDPEHIHSTWNDTIDLRQEFLYMCNELNINVSQCFSSADTFKLFHQILVRRYDKEDDFTFILPGHLRSADQDSCYVPWCGVGVRYKEVRPAGYRNDGLHTPHYWIGELNSYFNILWGHHISKPPGYSINKVYSNPLSNTNGSIDYYNAINETVPDSLYDWMREYLCSMLYTDHVNGNNGLKATRAFIDLYVPRTQSVLPWTYKYCWIGLNNSPNSTLATKLWEAYDNGDAIYNHAGNRDMWRNFGRYSLAFPRQYSSQKAILSFDLSGSPGPVTLIPGPSLLGGIGNWASEDDLPIMYSNDFTSLKGFYDNYAKHDYGNPECFNRNIGYFWEDDRGYLNFQRRPDYFIEEGEARNTLFPQIRFYETINLSVPIQCSDLCQNSSCTLCVKWVRPKTLSKVDSLPAFSMEIRTCEEKKYLDVRNYVVQKYQEIVKGLQNDVHRQIQKTCTPANREDYMSLQYDVRTYHYTLYYYDRAGRLMKTVPPEGVDINPARSRTTHPSHHYITHYGYNSVGQMINSQTPDGGLTSFWYNDNGQLRFSRNAQQEDDGKYSYTKYDVLGRVREVGQATGDPSQFSSSTLNNADYPTSTQEHISKTVYTDAYSSLPSPYSSLVQMNTLNRVSYTVSDPTPSNGSSGDEVTTIYSYDIHGNVEWMIEDIPGLGASKVETEYNLVAGNVTKIMYRKGYPDQYYQRYEYDADMKLKTVETSRDGVRWDKDACYDYYTHGPLKRMALGEDSVQAVDYVYTIEGWLKGVNHPTLDPTYDPGGDGNSLGSDKTRFAKDAYGMILGFYEGDFNRSSSAYHSGSGAGNWNLNNANALYNGNISSWTMNTRVVPACTTCAYQQLTGSKYRYDLLNRLRSDVFHVNTSGSWASSGDYDNAYTYDANGNIRTLDRNDNNTCFDALHYEYYTNSSGDSTNRLKRITDNTSYSSLQSNDLDHQSDVSNYSYDKIGNMVGDISESLTITWLPNGKIATVTKGSTWQLRFAYDAAGRRVSKAKYSGSSFATHDKTTYYMHEASGKNMATYDKTGSGSITLREVPLLGSSRLGLDRIDVVRSNSTMSTSGLFKRSTCKKSFELTDHLGNVRAVISDVKEVDGSSFTADIQSFSNYYPFGMQHPERFYQNAGYRYGYNGKEKDDEISGTDNSFDFGARIYNCRSARFWSVDPLASKAPFANPYCYALNDPIAFIDFEGLDAKSAFSMLMRINRFINKNNDAKTIWIESNDKSSGNVSEKGFYIGLTEVGNHLVRDKTATGSSSRMPSDWFPKFSKKASTIGQIHTHPYWEGFTGFGFDGGDIEQCCYPNDYVHMIESGSTRFALVVEDSKLFNKWIVDHAGKGGKTIFTQWKELKDKIKIGTEQDRVTMAMLQLLGKNSGVSMYRTTDPEESVYEKVTLKSIQAAMSSDGKTGSAVPVTTGNTTTSPAGSAGDAGPGQPSKSAGSPSDSSKANTEPK